MVAYVSGHTHANRVDFFKGRRGAGFWEINTASHIDWPEQSRTIEVMDNRDGTLSLFGTILDSAAPTAAPPPGSALGFSSTQLASLARTLSFNDPQRDADEDDPPREGRRADRNVELVIGPALAMLGAVAGLASREGVEVDGMEAAAVSYPGFETDLASLGG